MKILLLLWPSYTNPDLITKKLDEITVKMDDNWKIFALKGNLPDHPYRLKLSCPNEFYKVSMFGGRKSIISRISYFSNCLFIGIRIIKREGIRVVTQHDGHLEYGMTAYLLSRITHRKCLIRVNEDTLIPLTFFLKSSGNSLLRNKIFLKIVSSMYRRIEQIFLSHADWIITHGPMDYQKIRQYTNRITFVPLWVDTSKFKRLEKTRVKEFREHLNISSDVKVILFVGRLHPEKGVPTLFNALKNLQDMKILLLLVYSYSDYKAEYEKLAEGLRISDKIRFIGYVPNYELPNYYSAADLCVLPSMREQWSNTIMEAMACKTPVIATEVGGNPYLIVDGKTGFLIPPNDPQSLAKKIRFVFENPDLSNKVTEIAGNEIKKYDKDEIGELYKTVIKNLTNRQILL